MFKEWNNLNDLLFDIINFMKNNPNHTIIRADHAGKLGWVAFIENPVDGDEKENMWTIKLEDCINSQ